jgi:poly-gamma-glutamate synthesis protein (capsule biosynthesis protein)
VATDDFSIFLAGDAMITRPWSQVTDPAFLQLIEEIRLANVSITNLETVIHEFKGYPQRDCGGAYMASPPAIAGELRWAGFDMLAHANNHTFDYGSSAILETIEHVEKAGLVLAGSGADLQQARAPRYISRDGVVVGMVAMAASFIPYGQASRSRVDVQGRPGLNPLTLTRRNRAIVVPPNTAGRLRALGRVLGRAPHKLEGRSFKVGFRFHVGRRFGIERSHEVTDKDRNANLKAVSEAASNADIVVASIHAHFQGRWLREFAMDVIERGASVVFVHGPHEVRAIEFHHGKPIFYSMGDFLFEVEGIERIPAEAYERVGLGDEASPRDMIVTARRGGLSLLDKRPAFEGFATVLTIAEGRVAAIRLLPLDLQFDAPGPQRGRPRIARPELGKRIIESVAALSQFNGTLIRYDPATNRGLVQIP